MNNERENWVDSTSIGHRLLGAPIRYSESMGQDSGVTAEQCLIFSLLALSIWVWLSWSFLFVRGALSAGLLPSLQPGSGETGSDDSAHSEEHYRIAGLVKLWRLSRETVRQMIKDDPHVVRIRFGRKRSHVTYTVPESAARDIHAQFGGLESGFDERHYRIADLASLWKIGRETVRLMVKDEPGVMKVCLGRKKSHTTYSVPDSVVKRIHNRLLCTV